MNNLKPVPGMGGTNRNRPCPCGSGHKFKKCCGLPVTEEQKSKFAQLWAMFTGGKRNVE